MCGAADDTFKVLCRDDDFQEMVCEGLDATDLFFVLQRRIRFFLYDQTD
jgi:hypothetical protein